MRVVRWTVRRCQLMKTAISTTTELNTIRFLEASAICREKKREQSLRAEMLPLRSTRANFLIPAIFIPIHQIFSAAPPSGLGAKRYRLKAEVRPCSCRLTIAYVQRCRPQCIGDTNCLQVECVRKNCWKFDNWDMRDSHSGASQLLGKIP